MLQEVAGIRWCFHRSYVCVNFGSFGFDEFVCLFKVMAIEKWSVPSVFKIAILDCQSIMQFAMIWSIVVAEFFPAFVGLFIDKWYYLNVIYINLTNFYTFLFC